MKSFVKNAFALFAIVVAVSLPLSATAQSYGQMNVPSGQARADLNTRQGVVVDMQVTQIEVQASQQARGTGAVIGALIGAALPRNSNWGVRGVAGALGGLAGGRAANAMGHEMRDAMQVVVMLPNQQLVTIVQEMPNTNLQVGDKVFLIGAYPATRVVRAPTNLL
jgi:outer membrane lipoprotein SlyB